MSIKPPHITQSFHTERLGKLVHCIQAELLNAMALANQFPGPIAHAGHAGFGGDSAGENVACSGCGPESQSPELVLPAAGCARHGEADAPGHQ